MNGFVNVYKEKGMTSHDVVNKIRKIFGTKKVGHTGTLDPNATGVLPVAINTATKVIEYMEQDDKMYIAELTLGVVTDTEDIWGNIISRNDVFVSESEIVDVVKSFIGKQKQVPPMYSALKVDGKKLYELAREGKVIERQARDIEIFSITDIEVKENKVTFMVHCSKGTYIRTLCSNIGEKLGCGGTMSGLERVQSGKFTKESSVTLSDLENDKEKYLIDLELPLSRFPIINLDEEQGKKYINGMRFNVNEADGRYRVYIGNTLFGMCIVENGIIKSEKKI